MGNTTLLDDEQVSEPDLPASSKAVTVEDAAEGSQEPETLETLSEGLITGEDTDESSGDTSVGSSGESTSSDGNTVVGTDGSTGSGTSQFDSSGTLSPDVSADTGTDIGTYAGTDALLAELLQNQAEYQELILSNQEQLLVSNQRVELQLEACISILLIIIIVGALNYIYKFFKIFF